MNDRAMTEWEPVLSVDEYYDGPRNGVAEYRGRAHAYQCDWDKTVQGWKREYLLSPVDDVILTAVKEKALLWRRYQEHRNNGLLQLGDRCPTLAADRPRYDLLGKLVEQALQVDETTAIRAIPEFRGTIEPLHDFEARWLPC